MKNRVCFFIVLSGYAALFGSVDIPPLPDAPDCRPYDERWSKYGAYYDKIDIALLTFFGLESVSSRIEVLYKLKILTNEGASYGTVPIIRYSPRISKFEVRLYDSSGKEIKIDQDALKKVYLESGKVVVPKVTKGSTFTIRIEFMGDFYYYHFSEWFSLTLPVRNARFVHQPSPSGKYDYKTIGSRGAFEYAEYKKGRIKTWTIRNLEPRKDIDYLDHKAKTEPVVMARLLKVNCWNRKYNEKKEIFKGFRDKFDGISREMCGADSSASILASCINKTDAELDKARKIITWVQNHMTSTEDKSSYSLNIISSGNATEAQITSLCTRLFKKAGIDNHIVIAGQNNLYSLDSTFLFWSDWITTPLPVVVIGGREYVAYPFARGYELGEYPLYFKDELCMDLKTKSLKPLPKPVWGYSRVNERRTIRCTSTGVNGCIHFEYLYNNANYYRNTFLCMNKDDRKKYFEKYLEGCDQSNRLQSFSIHNLDEPGKELSADVVFTSDNKPIFYENKQVLKLGPYFSSYFKDITPDRMDDVFTNEKTTYVDELEIIKNPGKNITVDIKMDSISNRLFSAAVERTETDSSIIFRRTMITPVDGRSFSIKYIKEKAYGDIQALNGIKNGNVVFE